MAGRPRKAVLAGAILIGVVIASTLLLQVPLRISPGSGARDSVPVGGMAYIKVYDSQGKLVTEWQGHNSLFPISQAAIAKCLSGVTTNPPGYVGCNGYTDLMWIYWSSGPTTYYDIEQTSLPGLWASPEPTCSKLLCPTWEVTATFTGFTGGNCGASCVVSGANAGEACNSAYTLSPTPKIASSSTTCYNPNTGFSGGTTCTTSYTYDASGNLLTATSAPCSPTAASAPINKGANAMSNALPTFPTLCDSDGNCGVPITRDISGNTVSNQFVGFDTLSPSITVGAGDTLVATILYTVG